MSLIEPWLSPTYSGAPDRPVTESKPGAGAGIGLALVGLVVLILIVKGKK